MKGLKFTQMWEMDVILMDMYMIEWFYKSLLILQFFQIQFQLNIVFTGE